MGIKVKYYRHPSKRFSNLFYEKQVIFSNLLLLNQGKVLSSNAKYDLKKVIKKFNKQCPSIRRSLALDQKNMIILELGTNNPFYQTLFWVFKIIPISRRIYYFGQKLFLNTFF